MTWWDIDTVAHPEVSGIVLVTAHDVTSRVLADRAAEDANDALVPLDSRLRLAQDAAGFGMWEWEVGADRQAWSPQQFRLYGLDPAIATPPSFEEWNALVVSEDRARIRDNLARCERERDYSFQLEFRIRRADTGEIRWLLALGRVTETDNDGRCSRILGVDLDITDCRARNHAMRASETRLRLARETAGIVSWEWELTSDALEEAKGSPEGGFPGTVAAFRAVVFPDDAPHVEEALRQAIAGEAIDYRATFRMFRADGTIRWSESRGTVVRDESGRALRLVGIDYDVTAHKAVMGAFLQQQSRLRQFIEHAPVSLALFDIELRCLAVSCRFIAELGLPATPRGNLVGRRLDDVLPECPEAWIAMPPSVLAGEARRQDDDTYVRPDETRQFVCWSMAPWFCADGTVGGAVLAIQVTTARKAAKAALAESEAKFRALAELLPQLIYTARADGSSEYKNRRWLEYSGMTPEQARNGGWIGLLHPDDRDASVAAWNHAVRSGEPFEREHRLRGQDGEYRWFLARATPLREKADGPISRWIGTATEISGIVRAREAATRAAADLEVQVAERSRALEDASAELQAEARLRGDIQAALMQSQKLETLGQLTAGVAHDFNNVLASIQGGFEIIARQVAGQPVARIVEAGIEATTRAIGLTRPLLDFARARSPEPTVVDVAVSIRRADKMIGHAVGPRIDRVLHIQQGVWPVLTDEDQLEVALLNLAINARDAMPDGGRLVLEAHNLASGDRPETLPFNDYVSISVQDTGHGMPSEVMVRATETFFTTKPHGKGTGLGLPMVQAFASRSGGMLGIDSREGVGTTVTLILPRAEVSRTETPDSVPAHPGSRHDGQM